MIRPRPPPLLGSKSFDAKEIGFTLEIGKETLKELDKIAEENFRFSQLAKKYVWD